MARSTTALLAVLALALGGCLGGEERSTRIEGGTVTVYSSLPRHGVSAAAADAVAAGQRLALEEAGGRAGDLEIELVELDSSEPEELLWDPDVVSLNAQEAADDPRAIAYIGELDYGASAVSVPITNNAGLLQVSPLDGLTSLTRAPLGRPRAGPERYYPEGERSFLRLVPADELMAEALLEQVRESGASRAAVLFDGEIHSRELGGILQALARRDGPQPVEIEEYRGRVEEIPDVVRDVAEDRPGVILYASIAGPGTGRILAQLDRELPGVPVYATAGMLARDPEVPIPAAPAGVTALTPVPPPGELPRKGRQLLARLRETQSPAVARPEALYGYEAMRLVLDAIRVAGADRARVIDAALRIRARRGSPLGTYRIRATGEVETTRFALHALRDGRFTFERMLE
ncbi:MAG TPA: ABC transporter substrate-binding protein [Thermoleophilaceae bacterium]|nr:ABC transporter substrate-binding protein [Thermoleophilaceae bacterium]